MDVYGRTRFCSGCPSGVYGLQRSVVLLNLNAQGLNCIEDALVHRAFAPGQLVLDVGCGAGREAVPMAQHGIRVVAMDFVHEMVQATVAHASAHSTGVVPLVGDVTVPLP